MRGPHLQDHARRRAHQKLVVREKVHRASCAPRIAEALEDFGSPSRRIELCLQRRVRRRRRRHHHRSRSVPAMPFRCHAVPLSRRARWILRNFFKISMGNLVIFITIAWIRPEAGHLTRAAMGGQKI